MSELLSLFAITPAKSSFNSLSKSDNFVSIFSGNSREILFKFPLKLEIKPDKLLIFADIFSTLFSELAINSFFKFKV